MNRIFLDDTQLLQLKRFIILKGIKQEDVIHEILDHFACKVEELMNENIYLPFEKAVEQAYYSFGYNGFQKMTEQYEKKLKKIVWKEFKSALPTVLQTKLVVVSFVWCLALFMMMHYLEVNNIEGWMHEMLTYSSLATIILFLGIRFYSSLIAKDGLADYNFDKNIKLWQKKVIRMPRIDMINLPIMFLLFYLKLNFSFLMFYFMMISLLSLINGLTLKETMKRMTFKFNAPYANG